MKIIIRYVSCLGVLLLAIAVQCSAAEWLVDCDVALKKAREEHKAVLLDFTGSDWCGWCKKLKSEVFDQSEFESFADANLVLVTVDFPHRWHLSPTQHEANQQLAQKYGIHGFPTVIVLNSAGDKIGQAGYMEGGPKAFISDLERMPGLKGGGVTSSSRASSSDPAPTPHPMPQLPTYAPVTPNHYDQLALKGISGSTTRRLALINGETLMTGETAKVRVKGGRVEVTCKEIRTDSVLLTVDGKLLELKLAHP